MKNNLIFELSKLCLGNFGLTPTNKKLGLSDDALVVDVIKIEEGNDTYEFPLYSGQITIGSDKIRAFAVRMDYPDSSELIAVYQVNNLVTYGVRSDFTNPETSLFLWFITDKWEPLSRYNMLVSASGLENLISKGYTWSKCQEFADLKQKIVTLIEF